MERSIHLEHIGKAVCIFGSARNNLDPKYYKIAYDIAKGASQRDFAVVTGAGPGIMEAANKGAFENDGYSVGIRIQLPFEQEDNEYLHEVHHFDKFYSRKCALVRNSDIFVAMPGGFGTMDELFEVLTLMQCKKLRYERKVILVGKDFWSGLLEWLTSTLSGVTVSADDFELFELVDTAEEALSIIDHIGGQYDSS